jgi:hypothetical protein
VSSRARSNFARVIASAITSFLYFPSRTQVSPALRAFVDVAREMAGQKQRAS